MPKSSIESATPIAASLSSTRLVRTGSDSIVDSVISSSSSDGSTRRFSSRSRTWSGNSASSRFRTLRLTATPSVIPARCQARHWRSASSSTYRVSGLISPVCWASGMNSSGPTRPRVGWFQRSSASTDCTAPFASAAFGW